MGPYLGSTIIISSRPITRNLNYLKNTFETFIYFVYINIGIHELKYEFSIGLLAFFETDVVQM